MEKFTVMLSVEELCALTGVSEDEFMESVDFGDVWKPCTLKEREIDDLYRMDEEIQSHMDGGGCLLRRSNSKTGVGYILLVTSMNDYYRFVDI